jgi:hypothetical protein
MNVSLNIPLDTVNACLVALSKFPYEQAQPHIDLIRRQVEPQVSAAQQAQQQDELVNAGGTD